MIVGHRGAPARAPENTPASFAAAVEAGASWVELDARLSRDRVPVVRHDPDLPDGRLVAELDAAALAEAGVVDLASVLDGLEAGIGVDVEVKNLPGEPDYDPDQAIVAAVCAALAGLPPRPLLVTSFNPETIRSAHEVLPEVPTGWLYGGSVSPAAAAEIAEEYHASLLGPRVDVPMTGADVDWLHGQGLAVMVWTVNDAERLRELAAAGVDAVCTDDPRRACLALAR